MASRFSRGVVVAGASVLVLAGQPASAAPGSLDTSFSDDGKTSTPHVVETEDFAEDVIVQADGKIVVVGWRQDYDSGVFYTMVVRYLEDGTPDPAFGGGDGMVALPVGQSATGYAVGLLSDQRIAIAGQVRLDTTDWDLAAFLLTTTGELDPSFDDDGVAVVRFGSEHDLAFGIDVDASDRIVLGGRAETTTGMRMSVARLTSEGIPDPAFSSDGMRTVPFPGQAQARDLEIQSNGKIILAGRRQEPGGFALARLLEDGMLDPAFDEDGRVVTGSAYGANAVSIQPDGKIVAAGYGLGPSVDFQLVRYRGSGALDSTFSNDGIARTNFDGSEDIAWDVEVQPSGKILAIGHVEMNGQQRFGIVRYRPSGVRDLTFSGDGKANQVVGAAFGSSLDADPRLVVVGVFGGGMGTARYLLS